MSKSAVVLILCVILVATAFTGCLDWGEKKEKKAENQPPTADAGNDKTVNVGDNVQFNGVGSDPDGSIVLYEWNFGDGATSTAQNPIHQYTNAGTYMVMLTVTDDDGAADTDDVIISVVEVSNLPPAAVTLYNPSDITADSMLLSWSQSIDDDFANYTIYQSASSGDIGTGIHTITAQSTTSYTVTDLSQSTTYYFTIRAYDTGGLYNDSSQVGGTTLSAVENHAPVPVISSPLNNDVFLTTDNIFFDGLNSSDPDNDTLTFYWASNISGYLSTQSQFYTTLAMGCHLITLSVNDSVFNASATVNITVNEPVENQHPAAVLLYEPTDITENSVFLSWSQNTDGDFSNYTIYESTTSEDLGISIYAITVQSTTSYTVTDLQPDRIYYFIIRVYDEDGLYNDSNQVDAATSPSGPSSGPYYHQIYSATSNDGLSWVVNNTLLFDHASVPGAVYFDSKLYLYFVNAEDPENEKLSVGISEDNGATFTVHDVQITGSNSPYPVDPNPIVHDNQIRLTYLGNFMQNETNKIVTAVSSDGINFNEDGVLFTGEVYDPDLFYDEIGGEWVLFVSTGAGLTKATSSSPTVSFTEDTSFNWTAGGISSTHKIGGKYYTYYAGNGISVAEYKNGELSNIADGIVAFPNITADPTVAVFGSNDYKMFFKTMVGGGPGGPGGLPPLFSPDVSANLSALFDEYNNSVPKDVLITWLNDTGNQMLEGMVGPSQHKLYTAYSLDGINVNGTEQPDGYIIEDRTFLLPNASVPDAVVSPDNTTIRLYFVDAHPTRKIINALTLISGENVTADDLWFLYNEYYIGGTNIFNTAKSTDGENFTFECMRISGLSEDYMLADPSVVVLENGSYRIYFLYVAKTELPDGQGDPAAAKNQSIACAYSSDGANFTFEGVCYSGVYGECMSDPEVFKTGEYYRLYLHPDAGIRPFRYVNSTDGGRTFTGDVVWIQIEHMWDVAGCGCRIIDTGDGYRIYFGYNGTTATAFSSDGVNWVFDDMPKVGGRGYMAAVWFKGMYFLYFHA